MDSSSVASPATMPNKPDIKFMLNPPSDSESEPESEPDPVPKLAPLEYLPTSVYLDVVCIGETGIHDLNSHIIHACNDEDVYPDDPAVMPDSGLCADPFTYSPMPRALFEIGNWLPNYQWDSFADYCIEKHPPGKSPLPPSSIARQYFLFKVMQMCPYTWIDFDSGKFFEPTRISGPGYDITGECSRNSHSTIQDLNMKAS
ncbi:hypothetical protein NPX13_g11363 [Xylaria arbuscula]|uniref:Uncharacterized protein n=1 Tax=Xylaria arbuscula TaxID=114810 RepID=A0A9W8N2Z5_9PEZI|nr:hypothetical protein NPX13_g11363 [Xylaria arbuscula]